MRQPFLSPDGALAFVGALLLLSVAFTHSDQGTCELGLIVFPSSWMNNEIKPDLVLAALARIEASMEVFTTELATIVTRLDQLQSSVDAIREDLDREKP